MSCIDQPSGAIRGGIDQAPGTFKPHRDGNELLLRTVVQITFDPPAGVIGRRGDPRAGSLYLAEPYPGRDVPAGHDHAAAAKQVNRCGRIRDCDLRAVLTDERVLLELERFAGPAGP